jgi:hypothetical protein
MNWKGSLRLPLLVLLALSSLSKPGTSDLSGNGRRRRLRMTGSLQASCNNWRTPHSASIVCLRTATAVFDLAPCCSNHCDTNSFI